MSDTFNLAAGLSDIASINRKAARAIAVRTVHDCRRVGFSNISQQIDLASRYVLVIADAARRLEGIPFDIEDDSELMREIFALDSIALYDNLDLHRDGLSRYVGYRIRAALTELAAA